jgi:hypothetical protein
VKYEFSAKPSNGRRLTAENKLCSANKVPLIIDRPQPNSFAAHAWKGRSVDYLQNPSNGNSDTDEKAFCPPSKVLFLIDRSQT